MADLPCFWPADWVASEKNYAFIDDHGNIGLLDWKSPGVYEPHLYFSDRGGEALARATAMIAYTFAETDAQVLNGHTPILCKGAWYIVRKIGFKRVGLVTTDFGPEYVSVMTRSMWDEILQKA